MPSNYDSRSRGRPLGITILCLLGFIGVFFSSLGMLGVVGRGGPFAVVGLVGLALVVGKGVVLFGLWSLQEWGYKSGATSGGFACTPSRRCSTS